MSVFDQFAETFLQNHPEDAARFLETLLPETLYSVFQKHSPAVLSAAVSRMFPSAVAPVFVTLPREKVASLLEEIDLEVVAAILRSVPKERRTELLLHVSEQRSKAARELLRFSADSAAGNMDPSAPCFTGELTVGQVRKALKERPKRAMFYVYVIDGSRKLVGVLTLRDLFQADSGEFLEKLMLTDVTSIEAEAPISSILFHPGWNEFHALPVVDEEGRFLGAIRYKTFRSLQSMAPKALGGSAVSTGLALGELFVLGLRGVGEGLAQGLKERGDKE